MNNGNQTPHTDTRPTGEFLQYGGQAVIEGVMMRSPHYFAVACRTPEGEIVTQCEEVDKSFLRKLKWLNKPFLRGTLALLDAMILGNRALSFASRIQLEAAPEAGEKQKAKDERRNSPQQYSDTEEGQKEEGREGTEVSERKSSGLQENPPPIFQRSELSAQNAIPAPPNAAIENQKSKIENPETHPVTPLVADAASVIGGTPMHVTHDTPKSNRINDIAVGGTIIVSLIFGFLLFRAFPTLMTEFAEKQGWLGSRPERIALNAFDGLIRATMFFAYILLISRLAGIHAVFQYHGAEHKAINTLEANLPLTRENALNASRIHPRCGTSFIVVVMAVDFLICLFLPRPVWFLRILLHLAVMPPVAGIAYEVIKFAGKFRQTPIVMAAFAPGMWSQYLTTREPTPEQVDVALEALYAVLEAEGHHDYIPGRVATPVAPDPEEPAAVIV